MIFSVSDKVLTACVTLLPLIVDRARWKTMSWSHNSPPNYCTETGPDVGVSCFGLLAIGRSCCLGMRTGASVTCLIHLGCLPDVSSRCQPCRLHFFRGASP